MIKTLSFLLLFPTCAAVADVLVSKTYEGKVSVSGHLTKAECSAAKKALLRPQQERELARARAALGIRPCPLAGSNITVGHQHLQFSGCYVPHTGKTVTWDLYDSFSPTEIETAECVK